jgi:hypothetical protein
VSAPAETCAECGGKEVCPVCGGDDAECGACQGSGDCAACRDDGSVGERAECAPAASADLLFAPYDASLYSDPVRLDKVPS